jgi:uncharacterized membrane protein
MTNNDDLLMRLESTGCDKGFPWTTMQEAAATIRKQQAEIERLRNYLERIEEASNHYAVTPHAAETLRYAHQSTRNLAREALKGEGDE